MPAWSPYPQGLDVWYGAQDTGEGPSSGMKEEGGASGGE